MSGLSSGVGDGALSGQGKDLERSGLGGGNQT